MPAKLSTHVLDLASGGPASGMTIELWQTDAAARRLIKTVTTNSDGRTDAALLEGAAFMRGRYELVFFVRDYFSARQVACEFLDRVPVAFVVSDAGAAHHVPLLVTPWAYQTYRGS
ncbi:MAG: pucM [Verrucomicrobia bacterium]|nr:pucM [Verrucomicrobiota bacterium]